MKNRKSLDTPTSTVEVASSAAKEATVDAVVHKKHTPGPWTYEGSSYGAIVWAGAMRLCDLRGWGHLTGSGGLNLPPEQAAAIQDANGFLIAAAPLMLDALKALMKFPRNFEGRALAELAALDAIAKAEGRL